MCMWGVGVGKRSGDLTATHIDFVPILLFLALSYLLYPLLMASIPEGFKV